MKILMLHGINHNMLRHDNPLMILIPSFLVTAVFLDPSIHAFLLILLSYRLLKLPSSLVFVSIALVSINRCTNVIVR